MQTNIEAFLEQAGLSSSEYTKSGNNSYRGPCPKCKGSRRFLIFTDRPFPSWYCMCDGCGFKGWLDEIKPSLKAFKPDEDALAAAIKRIEAEKTIVDARRRERQEEFSTQSQVFDQCHLDMTIENRNEWVKLGIPYDYQVYWNLGFVKDRIFSHKDRYFKSDAFVMPKYATGWKLMNADYRLVRPIDGVGKYRPEPYLLPAPFITNPDTNPWNASTLLITEGTKKAMVTRIAIKDPSIEVVGIPGSMNWCKVDELAKGASTVFVILDPDAQTAANKLAMAIGENALVVLLPAKIDDCILEYDLTWPDLKRMLKTARRPIDAA